MSITYNDAVQAAAAAVAAAESMSIAVAVVVLNASAEPIATGKMDRAYRTAPVLAQKKAFTALNFGVPTATMIERMQSLDYQLIVANADTRLTFLVGGMPIVDDHGEVIGAIGVSGGAADQDVACCEAGIGATGVAP